MELRMIDDPRARLRAHERPDECWMWCAECTRFFRYGRARRLGDFAVGCPFPGCCGYGVGYHLFLWDDMREPDDPRWPSSEAELQHGMKSPDMEPFYAAREQARLDALVGAFERSAACARELGGEPHRHLRSFLEMMAHSEYDLSGPHAQFCEDLADSIVPDFPWSVGIRDPSEAPRIARELRAFGAFAREEGAIVDADPWCAFFSRPELEERLRDGIDHGPPWRRLAIAARDGNTTTLRSPSHGAPSTSSEGASHAPARRSSGRRALGSRSRRKARRR